MIAKFRIHRRPFGSRDGNAIMESGLCFLLFRVCLFYDDGPTARRVDAQLVLDDVESPVSVEVAAEV